AAVGADRVVELARWPRSRGSAGALGPRGAAVAVHAPVRAASAAAFRLQIAARSKELLVVRGEQEFAPAVTAGQRLIGEGHSRPPMSRLDSTSRSNSRSRLLRGSLAQVPSRVGVAIGARTGWQSVLISARLRLHLPRGAVRIAAGYEHNNM